MRTIALKRVKTFVQASPSEIIINAAKRIAVN